MTERKSLIRKPPTIITYEQVREWVMNYVFRCCIYSGIPFLTLVTPESIPGAENIIHPKSPTYFIQNMFSFKMGGGILSFTHQVEEIDEFCVFNNNKSATTKTTTSCELGP